MSHVVAIEIEVKDLAALEMAAERACGLVAVRTVEFDWWGRWFDDYHGEDAAYRKGFDPEQYGTCAMALVQADSPLGEAELEARRRGRRLNHEEATAIRERHYGPGWRTDPSKPYSVGVVAHAGRPGYRLAFDTMDPRLVARIGGASADRLRQHYAVAATRRVAARNRHAVTETLLPDGSIRLVIRLLRRA